MRLLAASSRPASRVGGAPSPRSRSPPTPPSRRDAALLPPPRPRDLRPLRPLRSPDLHRLRDARAGRHALPRLRQAGLRPAHVVHPEPGRPRPSAIAVVGGTIAAFIASRIGFFSIFVSLLRRRHHRRGRRSVSSASSTGRGSLALVLSRDRDRRRRRVRDRRLHDPRRPQRDHREAASEAGVDPARSAVPRMRSRWARSSSTWRRGPSCRLARRASGRGRACADPGPGNRSPPGGVTEAPRPAPEAPPMLRSIAAAARRDPAARLARRRLRCAGRGGRRVPRQRRDRAHRGRRHRRPHGLVLVLADRRPRPGRDAGAVH